MARGKDLANGAEVACSGNDKLLALGNANGQDKLNMLGKYNKPDTKAKQPS